MSAAAQEPWRTAEPRSPRPSSVTPTDARVRDDHIAALRREAVRTTNPERAAFYEQMAERARRAVEIHAPAGSPFTAPSVEEAERRWAARTAEVEQVRAGLGEGKTLEELGLPDLGETLHRLLGRTAT